jgi:hypothetical protein
MSKTQLFHKLGHRKVLEVATMIGDDSVDTERGVNQYQVQFKTFFNLYLNHSTISNEQ